MMSRLTHMDLTPFVDRLRRDLHDTASAGGPETAAVAERLLIALDPAVRMVLLEVLAEAAGAITAQLDNESVDVRLAGREPEFVVTTLAGTSTTLMPPVPPRPPEPPLPDDGNQARITVRLPDNLKSQAESLALDLSQSLNTWIVETIRGSLGDRSRPDEWSATRRRVQGWAD